MPARFKPQSSLSNEKGKKKTPEKKTKTQTKNQDVVEKKDDVSHDAAWKRVHTAYTKSKSKNFLRGFVFSLLSVCIVGCIVVSLLPILWALDFDFSRIVKNVIPESVVGPVFADERVNMIILGKGGYENDAPDLTDSIIFASYDNSVPASESTATMVSIPRDLYINDDILGNIRINSLYAFLKVRFGHEYAMQKLMSKVSEIVGKPVHHYVVVDFRGFRDFVDRVDGITVDVPERLYDNAYPDSNYGYTTFLVEKGLQEFDGDMALKYVRSRHSTSDFDRSRRQQIVIRALKQKLLDEGYLKSPSKIEDLYVSLQDSLDTSLSIAQIVQVAGWMHDFDSQYQLYSYNLNDGCFESLAYCEPGGLLYAPNRETTDGMAVLLPNGAYAGNVSEYDAIQKFVHLHLTVPEFVKQSRELHVFNATRVPGIAHDFAMRLKSYGFNVPDTGAVGNADLPSAEKSFTYYDFSLSSDDSTLKALDFIFYGEQIPETLPQFATVGESAIEVILGDDASLFLRNY